MNKSIKTINLLLLSLLITICYTACEKAELRSTEYTTPTDKSFVRFVFQSPNTTSVMIKVNDVKINGNSTSGSAGIFPTNINIAEYAAITPNGTLKLSLPNTATGNDSVVLYSANLATAPNTYYSVLLSDSGINRKLDIYEDNPGPEPDSGFLKLRFVNGTANSTPYHFIRVDSASATVVTRDTLFRNVAYRSATGFMIIPSNSVNSFLRYRVVVAGTGAVIASVAPSTLFTGNSGNRRSMTVYTSGIAGTTFTPTIGFFTMNK